MVNKKKKRKKIIQEPKVPPKIFEAASNGKLVVFIGAGVSRIIGCPSWEELSNIHLKYLYDMEEINYHEFINLRLLDTRKLLSICKNIYETKNINPPSMETIFKGEDKLSNKFKIYEDLYSFKAIYVTTNYDNHLDKVAERTVSNTQINIKSRDDFTSEIDTSSRDSFGKVFYKKDEILISNLEQGNVIHLHGSINNYAEAIITTVDYINHYNKDRGNRVAVFLEEMFEKYTVLFAGYGLEEYEILEFLIKDIPKAKDYRHFMLYPMFAKDENLLVFYEEYYKALGISLIPYSIDKKGYAQLAQVIKKWAKEISKYSRPKYFYETVKLLDEVI